MGRKRLDPKSRPADGRRPYDQLVNSDPHRHYVLANPNDELTGVSYYENLGYEVERRSEGGVRPAVGKTCREGELQTVLGQVLMSCPIAEWKARVAEGQGVSDAWERRMLKDGNIEDGLRGQGFRLGVDPDNTSAPFVEVEKGA